LSYIYSRDVTFAVFSQGPYEESARYRDLASAVVDGLMRAALDNGVPVLSVSLTPHQYQETEHHKGIFSSHFVEKGREAARAAMMIVKTRERIAA